MDFALSEEQRMVQGMVRDFAQKEVAPIIKEYDRKGEMAPNVLPRMGELGILGICIPIKYGGQGMDYISLGLACEELEAVDTTLRVVMSVHMGLCAMTILQWGTEEQKQEFLVPLARGDKVGAGAFTEPGAGSDFANIRTTGVRDGDDYIINGEKMWISLASVADLALVTVRTQQEISKPSSGLTSLIVDLNSPGVTRDDLHGKLGVRAGSTGWINFQDVRVPAADRIGEEGEGFKVTMSAFDNGRYTVAAGATRLDGGQRTVRKRTRIFWCAHCSAPDDPGQDRPYGAGLRDGPFIIFKGRMVQEPWHPQYPPDLSRQVARHGRFLRCSQRSHPDPRRLRFQRRI
jgi:glutaryl-CoA dehydrogenase (non-decarboxylating)